MPKLGVTGDYQIYLVSGKSIAAGSGYRIINLPGQRRAVTRVVLTTLCCLDQEEPARNGQVRGGQGGRLVPHPRLGPRPAPSERLLRA
jgi:hypothetical protein